MKKSAAAAVALLSITSSSFSASFDCNKASNQTEKLICSNPTISKLDDDVAAAYSKAKSESSNPDQLKSAQVAWIKTVRTCNGDEACMIDLYKKRIVELRQPSQNAVVVQSPASTQAAPVKTTPSIQTPPTPAATPATSQTQVAVSGSDGFVRSFRDAWCKNPNQQATGQFDYKGVRTGDLCLAPDSFILAVKTRLDEKDSSRESSKWMTNPNALTKATTFTLDGVVTKDKETKIPNMAALIDPYRKNVYLGSFMGVICAADMSNSLNAGNSFRNSVDSKYGKPTIVVTEYEKLKSQLDAMEQGFKQNRSNAITVREAVNARDGAQQTRMIRQAIEQADKTTVESLVWKSPNGSTATLAVSSLSRGAQSDVGNCPLMYDARSVAFTISMTGSNEVTRIEQELVQRNNDAEANRVRNAPAPKF